MAEAPRSEPPQQPDDSEPAPERQAKLEAQYEANVAAGKPPYEGVRIRTQGELRWVMREREWAGDVLRSEGEGYEPANLSGVNLDGANLSGAALRQANLSGARVVNANLSGANLHQANLSGANLFSANLSGTDLAGARMDIDTKLGSNTLDTKTRLGDVLWNGVLLTKVEWSQAHRLGEEQPIATAKTREERVHGHRTAVRAYRQLATVLRGQGMNDEADGYAERAQVLQRRLFWQRRQVGRWAFWLLLEAMAGYGYRLRRILIAYALIVGVFAAAFFVHDVALGQVALTVPHALDALQKALDALQLSLNAIHGRVFFAKVNPDTFQSWLATVESIVGIVVEGVFVAMLIQRFFGR